MTTSTDKYTLDLVFALRMRNVPGARIGEIVAEVESHIAEAGEDPRDAFGSPKDYALALAPGRGHWLTPSYVGGAVLGALGGWLLAQSVIAIILGESALHGVPVWGALLLAVAVIGVMAWWLKTVSDSIVDPRTGRSVIPPQNKAIALGIAAVAMLVAVAVLIAR
jgi:hypothetical protein